MGMVFLETAYPNKHKGLECYWNWCLDVKEKMYPMTLVKDGKKALAGVA